jgi:hypothetical protein
MTTIERPAKTLDEYSKIYVYKNDPKLIGKGINATLIQSYEGAYIPFISEKSYIDRKSNVINYDNKTSHGTRPMHQTTFTQHKDPIEKNDYTTSHQEVRKLEKNLFKIFKLRIESYIVALNSLCDVSII